MNHNKNTRSYESGSIAMNSGNSALGDLDTFIQNSSLAWKENRKLNYYLEISLYTLFASFLFIMLMLPNNAEAIRQLMPDASLADPVGLILWIKMALFISSLVPLFWGLHYSSVRLKGRLSFKK